MKRIVAMIAALLFFIAPAFADVDLSSISLEELIELRQQINLELWNRTQIKSVTVPPGVYVIGKDIPAGHWSITTEKGNLYKWSNVIYCSRLDGTGKNPSYSGLYYSDTVKYPGSEALVGLTTIDIDMKDGMYLIIQYDPVVFTPYTGIPDLGFDW